MIVHGMIPQEVMSVSIFIGIAVDLAMDIVVIAIIAP